MTLLDRSPALSINEFEHHRTVVNGRSLHYVTAGGGGTPILLVHGFPESWWAFHRLIPLLAASYRVVAVDLPGFGDSDHRPGDYSSNAAAEDLHELLGQLGLGPVHLLGQDVAGDTVFRLAAQHPADVSSLVAVEMTLAGFGFEALADVAHGGAWHVGVLASPGAAEFVFGGRERQYLADMWFPNMTRVPDAVDADDLDEFVRVYSRPDAWRGALGLYGSALAEGDELRSLAAASAFAGPVLAVDAMSAPYTAMTMRAVSDRVTAVVLDGVGHHVALEAPERLAEEILLFLDEQSGADRRAAHR